eukprot:CAMPEP_0116154420 /NCGR_PEP_ID=MMETSP0329-20121206/21770_1 /TAXON_ID=697910 /ORGANISM="Pseudo-nitzschia arenysensis, Strain B593" /LENGTH=597 /DNA_ID=CAMNT_0003651397 /DNA_START=45 /DNA_END=1838 /DNA_ORIENTATION=-
MSSTLRPESMAQLICAHRYSAFLFACLLVLVSSFSTRLPSSGTNPNYQHACRKESHQDVFHLPMNSDSPFVLRMSSSQATTVGESQEVKDLFSKFCDDDSLIDKKTLKSMPPFAEMLADEDLLPDELDEIWQAASKSSGDSSRVDLVSFVKIYNDVDGLFEDDDADDDEEKVEAPVAETDDNELDEELTNAFKSICDEKGSISKDGMKKWEEIESLFEEGLLGEDEFEELWENALGDQKGSLDASGFLKFNMGLDDLFVLDDDDDEEEQEQEGDKPQASSTTDVSQRAMVVEGDNPPGVLFSQLADKEYLVGREELNLWTELKEMLDDGEILESELQEIYDNVKSSSSGKLDEEGFQKLYDEIEALFEEVDDDEDGAEEVTTAPQKQQSQMSARVKDDLLAFIDIIIEEDEERCGFGASEADQEQVLNILKFLEQQPTNMIVAKEGNIERVDLAGKWELLYTSSSAMKFNQGLSGIGGSFPNGKFGGFTQELTATKFLSDFEYKERIDVNPSSASFDVTVNGNWDLRKSISLFTGQPTVILNVEPDKVTYGPTSTRADHWKSLGPTNRLDLSYLDDDLRVMRGCTSADTLFVFKKVN